MISNFKIITMYIWEPEDKKLVSLLENVYFA